ncbi:unnamed protein product [Rhizoctonia solani]|uniref:Uncharacterized protein n=1 Tax=Rhizoctonia solani TaxID=456999 RepID=A0A8H3GX14_9AGAM|nr:unnamed protein product [Rhizoctonia solani]
MTIGQASKLSAVLANSDFKLHPSSPDLVHRKDSPWLSDLRAATESVLSGDSKLVKELYEAHLRTFGKGSSSLGAGEIADRINKFTARVLLTGEAVDGSIKYPPIAGRLVTPSSIIDELNLQTAVDAGMLLLKVNHHVCHLPLTWNSPPRTIDTDTMISKDCHENQVILLSHATECLAKAATALAEAAEAVAAAAKSFISDATTAVPGPQSSEPTQKNAGINSIVDYDSDSDSSLGTESPAGSTKNTNNIRDSEFTPGIAGNGVAPGTDLKEYLSTQSTLQGIQINNYLSIVPQQPTTGSQGPEDVPQPPPLSYRILLDNEADVLLAVCSLIRPGRKVVCYVRSSITALDVYETLISVTQVPVNNTKYSSSHQLERAVETFQQGHTSVLLLPATYSHGFKVNEPESWVIHVGWPTNEQLYKQQIAEHQAKNNVFVAYSKDKDIYTSSSDLIAHSQPWPHGGSHFKETFTALRPLFNKKLTEITAKAKAKVYTDWITLHGMRGPYHPPSWTTNTVVYRANLYLLDVLGYKTITPGANPGTQRDLPTVTPGFVTGQNLESAVEAGLLLVKSSSAINHISSLPHAHAIPAGTLSLNEVESSGTNSNMGSTPLASFGGPYISGFVPNVASISGGTNPWDSMHTPSRSASRISSIAATEGNKSLDHQENTANLPHVTEYLIIKQDFDVIPSICFLSIRSKSKNVVCFVKSLSTFEPLVGILENMLAKPVLPVRGNGLLSDKIKEALDSSSGCFLLCDMYSDRPTGLKDKSIDLSIHLGWVDDPSTYRGQIQHAHSTVIVLRREVQAPNGPELIASLGRAGVLSASASATRRYNRQAENSVLTPGRKQWKELLSLNSTVQHVRLAYMAWITHHYFGRRKEPEWTALDVATYANEYFKGLFCYGSDGDVLQERPTVTPGFVKHLNLEVAAAAGLLTVKK